MLQLLMIVFHVDDENNIKFNYTMLKQLKMIIIFVIFNSCNMSNYGEELSGSYHYSHMGKDFNYIYGKNNIYPNVREFSFNDNYIIVYQEPEKFTYRNLFASDLYSKYTTYYSYLRDSVSEKYYYNRKDILTDSTIAKQFKKNNVSFENSSSDIQISHEIADSIIKNNPIQKKIFSLKKVYWIIQIKGDVLYGPLSLNEFTLLKRNKKIDLEFD